MKGSPELDSLESIKIGMKSLDESLYTLIETVQAMQKQAAKQSEMMGYLTMANNDLLPKEMRQRLLSEGMRMMGIEPSQIMPREQSEAAKEFIDDLPSNMLR